MKMNNSKSETFLIKKLYILYFIYRYNVTVPRKESSKGFTETKY